MGARVELFEELLRESVARFPGLVVDRSDTEQFVTVNFELLDRLAHITFRPLAQTDVAFADVPSGESRVEYFESTDDEDLREIFRQIGQHLESQQEAPASDRGETSSS